jgi:hypothetical protein
VPKDIPAAIGFRAHTGWAAAVLLGGPANAPVVLDRRRVDLRGASVPFEVYHVARGLPMLKAEALLDRAREVGMTLAAEAIGSMAAHARAAGYRLAGCGVVLGGGWQSTSLEAIFASHPACHAAEGELYRDALSRAARRRRLAVTGARERELPSVCAKALGVSEAVLRGRVGDLGRELGPPWTLDQKAASMTAWLALLTRGGA